MSNQDKKLQEILKALLDPSNWDSINPGKKYQNSYSGYKEVAQYKGTSLKINKDDMYDIYNLASEIKNALKPFKDTSYIERLIS
jgi:hypothetical protein